ncbi:glutamate-cysteine ligase family protein, partial [Xanthomonas oryzae]|uniref:glutamate-cysteine ligase family protein n=1 Tax=Xanthomonas oryzae TaxID=347 RepID=UPI0021162F9A
MLASGEKPEAQWRIGTEHEQFGFRLDDLRPPTFDGERGIEASVTLEPAGQLELSGAPLHTIHDTCVEVGSHLNEVKQVADQLGLGFLGMGFQPKWSREAMPLMPKGRYKIMQAYMPNSTVLQIIVSLCHYWKTFRPRGRAVLNRSLEVRFEQYGEVVAAALSHADRKQPAHWYLKGLLLPGGRKSVEPMAARVHPQNVGSAHQSMHHLVADA